MSLDPATPHPDDISVRFLQRVYRLAWMLTLVGILVIGGSGSSVLALNFLIGACISVMALRSTQMLVQRYLIPVIQPRGQRWRFLFLLFAKVPLLIILFFIVTDVSWCRPLGLVLGVSIIPLAITLYGAMKIMTGGVSTDA